MRKTLLVIVAVLVLGGLAVLSGAFRGNHIAVAAFEPLSAEEMAVLAPRGRELAFSGDCLGCHSPMQGPIAVGGVPFDTPFGTLYSPNITPDPTYGIGEYTRADFHRVLRDGIARGGHNLYPAMPFVFTQITTDDDIDAIYAYMMSLEPIAQDVPANTGVFAFPLRPFMNFWTLLNFPRRTAPEDPDRPEAWNRGAYLVEGLGHCGACHTPMNFMMGTDFARALEGAVIEGLEAPSLQATALAAHGFDVPGLTEFLASGIGPQGTTFGGMYTVTHFSTGSMQRDDLTAIATYLLTLPDGTLPEPSPPPAPLPEATDPALGVTAGEALYLSACASCHGDTGAGIPDVAPAMRGNATLALENPLNLLTVMLNGIPTEEFPRGKRMYAMPPFAHVLSDADIARLATWLRAQWGGIADPVQEAAVTEIPRTRN